MKMNDLKAAAGTAVSAAGHSTERDDAHLRRPAPLVPGDRCIVDAFGPLHNPNYRLGEQNSKRGENLPFITLRREFFPRRTRFI